MIATADRDKLLSSLRQVFDELGLRIHKQNSSLIVHWPGGLGRATKAAAILTNAPESFYKLTLESVGIRILLQFISTLNLCMDVGFMAKRKLKPKSIIS